MNTTKTIASIAGWIARVLALLLCLFWGAFFLEHLQEWFLHRGGGFPPARVWIGQALHLAIIVGLAILVFRPILGSVVTIAGTVAFFAWIGYRGFPYIALVNLPPIVFVLVSWTLRRGQHAEGAAPKGGPGTPPGDSGAAAGPASAS